LTGNDLIQYKTQIIQSDYLLPLLQHPEDGHKDSPIWTGLPRKIKTKLINTYPQPKNGWGFSVEEQRSSLAFTILMCPVILFGFAIATWLSIKFK